MQEVHIERVFNYNGIKLADPNPALQADAVREFYVPQYMELTTAVVEGPVTKDNVATYTFRRAAGAKGRQAQALTLRQALRAVANGDSTVKTGLNMDAELLESMHNMYLGLLLVARSKNGGRAHNLSRHAFGLWG
jgi:PRTRC genetic system protein C